MNFAGLPPTCPPPGHAVDALPNVFRILQGTAAAPEDWLSHAQLKKNVPPGMDPCRWASLSLCFDPKKVTKLKNLQDRTHAAALTIPADVGAHATKGNHVDFWVATGGNVATYVVNVARI
jgi:hypothetical protein